MKFHYFLFEPIVTQETVVVKKVCNGQSETGFVSLAVLTVSAAHKQFVNVIVPAINNQKNGLVKYQILDIKTEKQQLIKIFQEEEV
jgi:hypothetical protein